MSTSLSVVIRPGHTDFDEQSRIQGALNLPLSARGRLEVSTMIETLRPAELDVIYTSPTEPARSTAQAIGDALDIPVKELDGLCNLDQGLWQGMLLEEIRRKQPRVYRQWVDAPDSVCPPQGETCGEACKRVAKALKKPIRRGAGKRFAVVAPEPLATLVSCVLRGDPPKPAGPVCTCDPVHTIEYIERPVEHDSDGGTSYGVLGLGFVGIF